MPLTVRTNGSGGSNIIQAAWFNDFLNLLTGAMQDQEVTIRNVLVLQAIGPAPTVAPTAAPAAGTGLGIGAYGYVYTFANADGETTPSPAGTMTTTSGNQVGSITGIAAGPTGTTQRKLYRTAVGGGTNYKFVVAIADNTTTTYTDTLADGSLGSAPPAVPSFGGTLIIKDSTGAVKFKINNDGTFSSGGSGGSLGNTTIAGSLTVTGASSLDNTNLTTDGSGNISKVGAIVNNIPPVTISGTISGTLTAYMDFRGTVKRVLLRWNNFKNGGTTNTLILPVAFATGGHVSQGNGNGFTVNLSGGASVSGNNVQTSVGSASTQTDINNAWFIADINGPFDRIVPDTGSSTAHTGWTLITGN